MLLAVGSDDFSPLPSANGLLREALSHRLTEFEGERRSKDGCYSVSSECISPIHPIGVHNEPRTYDLSILRLTPHSAVLSIGQGGLVPRAQRQKN